MLLFFLLSLSFFEKTLSSNDWPLKKYSNGTVALTNTNAGTGNESEIVFETDLLTIFNKVQINNIDDVENEIQKAEDLMDAVELELLGMEIEHNIIFCASATSNGPRTVRDQSGVEKSMYCNSEVDGGGWNLLYTINPADGHNMDFASPYWTQSTSSEAVSASVIGNDYVNGDAANIKAREIMIMNGYKSDGTYNAYTIWPFRNTTKSMLDHMRTASATCNTGHGNTFNYTKRVIASNVPFDSMTSQGGELYINYQYGNNVLRLMTSEQCAYKDKSTDLSCTNDDSMLGIGGDFSYRGGPADVYPGIAADGKWNHDVLLYDASRCLTHRNAGRHRPCAMGTNRGSSMCKDPSNIQYKFTVWVR